jgi:hypothetical protein
MEGTMTANTRPRKCRRKVKRESSPFCPDPRQLDLVDYINDELKRRAFARLDKPIERALKESTS